MGLFYDYNGGGSDERVSGVVTGEVRENWDEKHPGMVKVEYFLGEKGKNTSGWMPVASFYAYNGCGAYVLPEIGSEVVVAFNMGDRNCPMVIGSLWNKKNVLPDKTANKDNIVRRFKTKGGCEVEFSDEKDKQSIDIHTPKGLKVSLADEKSIITISDKEGKNLLTIKAGEGAIEVTAEKKLTLSAGGKSTITLEQSGLTLKADKINAEAGNALTLKGQSVKAEGNQMNITGKSQMNLSSSGNTKIKGSLVNIG